MDLTATSIDLSRSQQQVSSSAVIKMAELKRAEQQDREVREARKHFLEDIQYWTAMKQLDLSGLPNSQGPLQQDPFTDEASAAWAEHEPPQGSA
ncbi:hypothetical protein C0995_006446 [Termitomyces sp. Mi166|nr:hypothetical protein C0995_006446 [Termitomyces sp. Mi166\